ncbi:MAG TPA: hypothetical protein VM686_14960 [Polyangiaceae bacterium]|nr:hypothetical protein [Polyangiaceae bacterium]
MRAHFEVCERLLAHGAAGGERVDWAEFLLRSLMACALHWAPVVMKTSALSPFALIVLTVACGGSPETGAPAPAAAGGEAGASSSNVDEPETKPGQNAPRSGGAGGAESEPGGAGGAAEPAEPFCGDGNVDPGEDCDDGNDVRGDLCNPDCVPSGQLLKVAKLELPNREGLRDLVIVGDKLVGVGASMVGLDHDRLIVSADITKSPLVLEGKVDGDPLKREFLTSVTSDGEMVFISGLTDTDAGNEDALLESRSLAGDLDWARTMDGTQHLDDYMCGVALHGDNLIAIATTNNLWNGQDLAYGTFYKSNQQEPVTTTVSSNLADKCAAVEALGDGAVLAGKQERADGGSQLWLRRVDAAMGTVWTKTFPVNVTVSRLATGPNETTAVAGYIREEAAAGEPANTWDSWVMLVDGSGNELWTKRFDHSGNGGHDYAEGVAIDPENGDVVIVGGVQKATPDPFIQRLAAANGAERWFLAVEASGYDDGAIAVTIADDGTLWVGGYWSAELGEDAWVGQFTP